MDASKCKISSAKLRGEIFLNYAYHEPILIADGTQQGTTYTDAIKRVSDRPVHEDLRTAWHGLVIHVPLILMYLKPGDIADINSPVNGHADSKKAEDWAARFTLSEIEWDHETDSIKFWGSLKLDLGTIPVETPFVRLDGDYHYALELHRDSDALIDEIEAFMEGKQAPVAQQAELFPSEPGAAQDKVVTEASADKPKRGRGRPKKQAVVTTEGKLEVEEPAGNVDASAEADLTSEPLSNYQRDPSEVPPLDEF